MKIAVISSFVLPCPPPGYSGLEMIAWQCARGLAELGHEVLLIGPDDSSCPGCSILPCGPQGMDERQAFKKYAQTLLQMDCIIDHSWMKASLSLKASGQLKSPSLCVMHAPINTMISSLPPNVEKPCFVCISQDQANHFDALFNYQPKVCYNGVDLDFYRDIALFRKDRFLFLARFSSIKGADLAIEACLKAGVGLDLVGDTQITNEPEYFDKCMSMAKQTSPNWDRSKGEQIRVIGGVSRSETVHWFSRAYCMLHPNQRFREPFGLAPVEAMACGCPVIAWNYGAMRETIGNNMGGITVKSVDELTFWIRDWANAKTTLAPNSDFRKRCREWASRFSVANMVLRYEELCKEAVNTGGW